MRMLERFPFGSGVMNHQVVLRGVAIVLAAASMLPAWAQIQPRSEHMPFEDCLKVIQRTGQELRSAPVTVMDSADIRMVRFPTASGSVLVTCSWQDQRLVITPAGK
jgi:hypothetical protein